jgi:phage/plasmid-associated DNA primase
LVEGEKDADRLNELGHVATCSPKASGGLPKDFSALSGRHVVIIADRDTPGAKHAELCQTALEGVAESVEIRLPRPEFKGADVSDHIGAGYSLDDLELVTGTLPESVGNPAETSSKIPATGDSPSTVDDGTECAAALADVWAFEEDTQTMAHWVGTHWERVRDSAWRRAVNRWAEHTRKERTGKQADKLGDNLYLRHVAEYARLRLRVVELDDARTDLLPTPAGVINLNTLRKWRKGLEPEDKMQDWRTCPGVIRPADPATDTHTLITAADPTRAKTETSHRILGMLSQALPNADDMEWVLRWLGCALRGSSETQPVLVALGPKASNGKTTTFNAFARALGVCSTSVNTDLLLGRNKDALVPLRWKRLALMEEWPKDTRAQAHVLKKVAKQSTITTADLYQPAKTTKATHSLAILTNYELHSDVDNGVLRRFEMVRFDQSLPETDPDIGTVYDTDEGLDAFLWLVLQFHESAKVGEGTARMQENKRVWRDGQDPVRAWLSVWRETHGPGFYPTSVLHNDYLRDDSELPEDHPTQDRARFGTHLTRLKDQGESCLEGMTFVRRTDASGRRARGWLVAEAD